MNKPVGGRGNKASYKTTVIRIPIDLKSKVDELVYQFRGGSLEIVSDDNFETKISDLRAVIERYKLNSKASRDWVKFNQLIAELEQELGVKST